MSDSRLPVSFQHLCTRDGLTMHSPTSEQLLTAADQPRVQMRTQKQSTLRKRCSSLSDDGGCLVRCPKQRRLKDLCKDDEITRGHCNTQRSCKLLSSGVLHVTNGFKGSNFTTVSNQRVSAHKQPETRMAWSSVETGWQGDETDCGDAQRSALAWLLACALAYNYFCSSDGCDEDGRSVYKELNFNENRWSDGLPWSLLQDPNGPYIPKVVNPAQAARLFKTCAASLRFINLQ